jgi:hypothetical protein
MMRLNVAVVLTTVGLAAALPVGLATLPAAPAGAAGALPAFRSDAELRAFLRRVRGRAVPPAMTPVMPPPMLSVPVPAPPPPPAAPAASADAAQRESITVTGARASSITNTQVAGVDEGGIVKLAGDTLVILRRGRLFTVSLAGGGMRGVDAIDAFPPGTSGEGAWYDEMLIAGDRVVVIGYSYARGGTEVNRFRLLPGGRLRFEDAYQLRSNDYYSSRNYASRLIGSRLVFYTPLDLGWRRDPLEALPGYRRWSGAGRAPAFRPIAGARQVYIPPLLRDGRGADISTLHSVTTCDLAQVAMPCRAVAVLGPESRTFYVAEDAVYLWISDAWQRRPRGVSAGSFIYRLPLGGGAPAAVGARGGPVDQFSFQANPAAGTLDVLVRSEGGDDRMWRPEVADGDVALLRVPAAAFGDGSREVPASRYRPLPAPRGDAWSFRNRWVGPWLLYGAGQGYGGRDRSDGTVYAVPAAGGPVATLAVGQQVERIEPIGTDALVVGQDDRAALGFQAIELGRTARVGARFVLPDAAQGEERSHAFFFRADPDTPDGASGLMGLPVLDGGARAGPVAGPSAAMQFLRRRERRLADAGALAARAAAGGDDGCQASCVDWYGNARPIFLGTRTFALLGYELVEGRLADGRVREVGRLDYSPRTRRR